MRTMNYLIGIDEAGRGPLAGPVAVGIAVVPVDFDWAQLENVKDSKQLNEKKREVVFTNTQKLAQEGVLRYAVAFSSAALIDTHGISHAIRAAIERALRNLEVEPDECEVLLDGSLKAPERFIHQRTIIKGDASEPIISLASICAKVSRDHIMIRENERFPCYGFSIHKGYGTASHISAIREHGLSELHRKSFCTRLSPRHRAEDLHPRLSQSHPVQPPPGARSAAQC